jgi:uncharacterized protein
MMGRGGDGRITLQDVPADVALPVVRMMFTKWGGHQHWTMDLLRLGEDGHGVWLGGPTGLRMSKPGTEVIFDFPSVLLIPRGQPWTAAFNADVDKQVRAHCEVYIDIAAPAVWNTDGTEVTVIDLDLDVVRLWDGTVYVDDEDEFVEHQVRYNYPAEITELARRSCDDRRAALEAGAEPYASAYRAWLARVPNILPG